MTAGGQPLDSENTAVAPGASHLGALQCTTLANDRVRAEKKDRCLYAIGI